MGTKEEVKFIHRHPFDANETKRHHIHPSIHPSIRGWNTRLSPAATRVDIVAGVRDGDSFLLRVVPEINQGGRREREI